MRKLLAMLIALAMLLQMTGPVFAEAEPAEVQEAVAVLAAEAGVPEQEEAPVEEAVVPAEPETQPATVEAAPVAEETVTVEEEAPVAEAAEEAAPEVPAAPAQAVEEEEEELHIASEPEAVEAEEVVEAPAADEAPLVIPFIATVSVKAEKDAVDEGENAVLTAKVEAAVAYTVTWEAHDPATDVEGEEIVWVKVAEGESYTFVADAAKAAVEYRAVAAPVEGEGRAVSAAVTVAVIPAEAAADEAPVAPVAEAEEAVEAPAADAAEEEAAPVAETEEAPKADDAEDKADDEEEEASTEIVIDLNGADEAEEAEENADEEASEEEEIVEEIAEEEIEVVGADEAYGEKTLAVNAGAVTDTLYLGTKPSQIWKIVTTSVGSLNVYADPQAIIGDDISITLYNEDMSVIIDGPATGTARVQAGYSWLDVGTYYVKVESNFTSPATTGALVYSIQAQQGAAGIMMSNNRSQNNAYSVTNGTAITGAFTWQSGVQHNGNWYDYAQFTLDSASRVTVQVTDYTGAAIGVELYNGTITEKLGTSPSFNAAAGAVNAGTTTTREVYLESGTYFLRLNPTANPQVGKYELTVKWSSCEATEVEPNDGIGNPTQFAYGQTHRGALTLTDVKDYYRITTAAGYAQEVDITVNAGMTMEVSILDVNENAVLYNTFATDGYYYTAPSGTTFSPNLTNPYPMAGTEANKQQGVFHVKLLPSTAYYIVVQRPGGATASTTWNVGGTLDTGVYDITVAADKTVQSMVAAVYDNWAETTGSTTDWYQAVARFTAPGNYDVATWDVVNANTGAVLVPYVDYFIHGISTNNGQGGWVQTSGIENQLIVQPTDVWSAIVIHFTHASSGDQYYFRFTTYDNVKGRYHRHASFNVNLGGTTTVTQVNMPLNAINVGTPYTVTADLAAGSISGRTYLWWIVDTATGKTVDTAVTTAPSATFTANYTGTFKCQMFWWDPSAYNPITGQFTGYWVYIAASHDSINNPSPYRQTLTVNSGMGITSVVLTQKNPATLNVTMTTTTNPVYTNYVVYLDGVKQNNSYYFTNGTKSFDFTVSNSGTYVVYAQAWDGVSGTWVTVASNAVTIAAGDHLIAVTPSVTTASLGENVQFTMNYTGTLIAAAFDLHYWSVDGSGNPLPSSHAILASWSGAQPSHVFALNYPGIYVVNGTAVFASTSEIKTSDFVHVSNNAPYLLDADNNAVAAGSTPTAAILISNVQPQKEKGEITTFSIKTGGSTPTSIRWELYRTSDNTLVVSDESNKKSFVLNTATLDNKYMNKNAAGKDISTDFYVKVYLSSTPVAAGTPLTYQSWTSKNVTVYLPTAPGTGF